MRQRAALNEFAIIGFFANINAAKLPATLARALLARLPVAVQKSQIPINWHTGHEHFFRRSDDEMLLAVGVGLHSNFVAVAIFEIGLERTVGIQNHIVNVVLANFCDPNFSRFPGGQRLQVDILQANFMRVIE